MNKVILIALVAACIASSVQAFVKRDAPAPAAATENNIEKLKDIMTDIGDQVKKSFNPDDLQKKFNEAVEALSKGLDDIKNKIESSSKPETPKA